MKAKDLTGQKFGMLTVLEKANTHGQSRWLCLCDCGNETIVLGYNLQSGHTSSCGCLRHKPNKNKENLEGQKFNEWTVLRPAEGRPSYWVCQCSCGVVREVYAQSLKKGTSQSCGHLHKNDIKKPIVGKQFGLLTVLDQFKKNNNWYCTCKCECGNTTVVKRSNLVSGNTQSCGCIKSKGEVHIKKLLQSHNIPFVEQYTPPDIPNKKMRFDFFVNNEYLLEFDGPQHWGRGGGYFDDDVLERIRERDIVKNTYCLEHNIPLYRIPYYYRDTAELEQLTWDRFKVRKPDHYAPDMEEAQEIETA